MRSEVVKWVPQPGSIDVGVEVVVGGGTVVEVAEVAVAEEGIQADPKAQVQLKSEACSRHHCQRHCHCYSQSE